MADLTVEPRRVVSSPAGPATPAPVTTAVHTVTELGFGAAQIGLRALRGALTSGANTHPTGMVARSTRAAAGVLAGAEAATFDLAGRVEQLVDTTSVLARQVPVARDVLAGIDAAMDRWIDRADHADQARIDALANLVETLVPAVAVAAIERVDLGAVLARLDVEALLDQVDLNAIFERVDLNAVLARVDLGAVLERVDLNALLAAVDINALLGAIDVEALMASVDVQDIIDRVDVDGIVARVDVDGIVSRVDIDAIMNRVDLEALMGRLDLGPLVARVLDEVDIGGIVRDSTGSITSDARDSARIGAMRLDTFLGRVTDRVLLRGDPTASPEPTPDRPEEHGR